MSIALFAVCARDGYEVSLALRMAARLVRGGAVYIGERIVVRGEVYAYSRESLILFREHAY